MEEARKSYWKNRSYIDELNNHYSVKKGSAKHWQVFLYTLNRLENDQSLHDIKLENVGNFSELIVKGLKYFPQDFDSYNGEEKLIKENSILRKIQ